MSLLGQVYNYEETIYLSPIQGCHSSCSGTYIEPYDNFYSALNHTKVGMTSLIIKVLKSPNETEVNYAF